MRHLVSLVLSLVAAPLVYVAAGYATVKLEAATKGGTIHWSDASLGIGAGLLAGALYAILVMARLSPLGPFLAGLGYVGITSWALLDASRFHSSFSASILGTDSVLIAPVGAGTVMLAVPLLLTIFSPRRWRRFDGPAPVTYNAAPVYSTTVATAAPDYQSTPSYTPPLYTPSNYSPTVPEQTTTVVGEPVTAEGRTTTLTDTTDEAGSD
jgi:hypothetical protein